MRAVIQRVKEARVTVDGQVTGAIAHGLLILLGVEQGDDETDCQNLAQRCARLRIFDDDQGKMNRSLLDTGGAALVVSQFTLCADTSRGRRPSFERAAPPETARALYQRFVRELEDLGADTAQGVFGARMEVALINDGPVTIVLDSAEHRGDRGKELKGE